MHNFDHHISFWEKLHFLRRKLPKIAENCDHNIDPRCCATFSTVRAMRQFCPKLDWATFWATFSQTHLVTLPPTDIETCPGVAMRTYIGRESIRPFYPFWSCCFYAKRLEHTYYWFHLFQSSVDLKEKPLSFFHTCMYYVCMYICMCVAFLTILIRAD
jgi:hypothetical protein